MGSFTSRFQRALKHRWFRFILVSAGGVFFSLPIYLILFYYYGLSEYIASPISNITAQGLMFPFQKVATFEDRRIDLATLSIESGLYACVVCLFVGLEPWMLSLANPHSVALVGVGILAAFLAWISVHVLTGPLRYQLLKLIFKGHKPPSSL
jgi:putative flippase GtrA